MLLELVLAAAMAMPPASADLLEHALDPNPSLNAYVAKAQLNVFLHGPIPLRKTFNGTMRYARPDAHLVLDDVNGALSRYRDLRTTLPTKDELLKDYDFVKAVDTETGTQITFAPKAQNARVRNLTLEIDRSTRLLHTVTWEYANASKLSIAPVFENVGSYIVAVRQQIGARFPGYSIDATLTLSDYDFKT